MQPRSILLAFAFFLAMGGSALALFGGAQSLMMGLGKPSSGGGGGGGGTIACDIGPPFQGSIPGPAAAFGLTHCINLDFTYTGNFSNAVAFYDGNGTQRAAGQTYNWSNLNTWANSPFGTSSAPLLATTSSLNTAPQVAIVNDSVAGTQVLRVQTFTTNNSSSILQINTPVYPGTNSFLEEVARVDPNDAANTTTANNGEVIEDFSYTYNASGLGGTKSVENDFGLLMSNGTPMSQSTTESPQVLNIFSGPNNPGGIGQVPHNPADNAYHVSGSLFVASNSTHANAWCGYQDHLKLNSSNSFNNCRVPSTTGISNYCTATPSIVCYQSSTASIGHYSQVVTATVTHWVQRLTIWVCPKWYLAAPNAVPTGTPPNSNMTTGCDSGAETTAIPGDLTSGPDWLSN